MRASAAGTASGPPPQAASGRKNAIRLIALASAARLARDALPIAVVGVIALVAAARLAREGRNPLDWYLAPERDKRRSVKTPSGGARGGGGGDT
jgi:hypothetical protein